nr:hypothetical protein Iba_chr11aCG18280 [Ipomoea batatas]
MLAGRLDSVLYCRVSSSELIIAFSAKATILNWHLLGRNVLEEGLSRLGRACKHKLALRPRGEQSIDHPIVGRVPPRNIDEHLHSNKFWVIVLE